jgi:nucleoside-diphosphate-sugar epimerase
MLLLITGCAGFIGARTAELALNAGHEVVGLDNLNDYYDPRLKHHRLVPLLKSSGFSFHPIDIEDGPALDRIFSNHRFDAVINLAARAGVRASIDDPPGDGSQTRDFTYIDDIARGTLAAIKPLGYEIINLGGGNTPVTISEMIRSLELHLGRTALISQQPFQEVDLRDTAAEIGKANRILEWAPQVPPSQGFQLTADWHRQNADWLDSIKL